jgi:hypothetical protein
VGHLKPRQYATWTLSLTTICLTAWFVSGCGVGSARKNPHEIKVQKIEREKTELMRDLQQARAENEQLAEQIKALSALPKDNHANPYALTSISITKYSNFYDKDDDGKREKFIVYFTPIDPDGDALKASGAVNVQLWNLDNLNGQALLDQWQVEPDSLRHMWFDTLVSAGYRLVFDTPEKLDILAHPLTVKVTFTDYLTGEILRDQLAINPRLDP